VELIKSTRKILKQKVRAIVDKVGPKLYKNFDKMRLIMRKPGSVRGDASNSNSKSKYVSRKNLERRTSSVNAMTVPEENFDPVAAEIKNVGNSELGDFVLPPSRFSSRRGSFEAVTDYDLPYLDELEINRAFNVFDKKLNL
jgi:hypothetical protein